MTDRLQFAPLVFILTSAAACSSTPPPAQDASTEGAPAADDPSAPPTSDAPINAPSDKAPGEEGHDCGGMTGASCAAGLFCLYPIEATCGAADQTGVCTPIPEACTMEYSPVCGCDDKTHSNACQAHAEGISVAREGECQGTAN